MSVSEHAQSQSCGSGSSMWNAAFINVISSTCAFPASTRRNVCREKGLYQSPNMPNQMNATHFYIFSPTRVNNKDFTMCLYLTLHSIKTFKRL